jgi:hypothetical protein
MSREVPARIALEFFDTSSILRLLRAAAGEKHFCSFKQNDKIEED